MAEIGNSCQFLLLWNPNTHAAGQRTWTAEVDIKDYLDSTWIICLSSLSLARNSRARNESREAPGSPGLFSLSVVGLAYLHEKASASTNEASEAICRGGRRSAA